MRGCYQVLTTLAGGKKVAETEIFDFTQYLAAIENQRLGSRSLLTKAIKKIRHCGKLETRRFIKDETNVRK